MKKTMLIVLVSALAAGGLGFAARSRPSGATSPDPPAALATVAALNANAAAPGRSTASPSVPAAPPGGSGSAPSGWQNASGVQPERSNAVSGAVQSVRPAADAAVPDGVPGMKPVANNGKLALFFQPETTEIAVKRLQTGEVWYSNPPGRQSDPLAEPFVKGRLGSQLSMTYYSGDGKVGFIDNFNESVQKKQFEASLEGDAVAVTYTIGDVSAMLAAPKRFKKERFEKDILPRIGDGKKREEFQASYRNVEETDYYEQWNNIPSGRKKQLLETLVGVGYTERDFELDNRQTGVIVEPRPSFKATLRYALDGDQLVVTMPMSKLTQSTAFPIRTVSLLEFFGAAGADAQGYMLVPDGSGALIRLNNGKTSARPLSVQMYGSDGTLDEKRRGAIAEKARLPVFGMMQDGKALFGIVERGDALANVEADVSGRLHSYNVVYPSFNATEMDTVTLAGNGIKNEVALFQPAMHTGDIVVRYMFLAGEDATYSGMANYYRSYLVANNRLSALPPAAAPPFVAELLGAIPKRTSFLGVPYRKTEALTPFAEAERIARKLKEADVANIALRYVGWFNGGLLPSLPTSIRPERALGGDSGFRALARALREESIGFYPDVSLLSAYERGLRLGPNPNASLFIKQQKAVKAPFNLATRLRDSGNAAPYFIVSPKKLPGIVGRFADAYASYGIPGLSLGDLGDAINSDYRKSAMVDRQQAAGVLTEQAEALANQYPDLLLDGGNAPMLPYGKLIVNAPLASSGYQLADETVPFYEMALHGYVDYAGRPANAYGGDLRDYTLKLLETGANVYFQWMSVPGSTVKDTEFSRYYSHEYADWFDDAIRMYAEVRPFLSDVRTRPIVRHERLADGVYRTTYGGGKTVTVNYNAEPATADGMAVPAKGYKVGGEHR
ncbi:DUF5696 domain-containing protein [Paenibacillus hodogayensis]|uniref:DUF5696 domain-containing protein n=1 Tax=Paenibacillus hodogayensis TaxID=279208 RepID=A0ABV5VXY9_9BACL